MSEDGWGVVLGLFALMAAVWVAAAWADRS